MTNEPIANSISRLKNLFLSYKHILLLLLIMALSFGYYVPKYGLIYDGGLYSSLGYSLQHDGSYVFNDAPGDVPPVYPIFLAISIFLLGENGIFIVTPIFSAVFIITVFIIFKREFDEDVAFLTSLLILFSPPLFFYSIQVVRDIPMMAFVILSYLIYFRKEKGRVGDILFGVSMGLAFLTKYATAVYLLPLFVHGFFSGKKFKIPLATVIILLLPWVAWSKFTHGTLLVSHSSYITKDLGRDVGRFFTFTLPLFKKWTFTPILLLSLLGFFQKVKKDKLNPFALLIISTLGVGVVWPEKDIRYILFAFILIIYFAIFFLTRFKKEYIVLFLLVFLIFQFNTTYRLVEANTYQNILFRDVGDWLKDNTPDDATLLSQSHRQINYFSHRKTYQPPRNVERIEGFINYYNISYAVVDTYEKVTPKYAYSYFNNYWLIKTFEREGNTIWIYNLSKSLN